MSGRKADSRRPQTASGKGNREKTKTDKDKAIKELTRRLDREIKKIAKFEQIERETREQHQLQIVFLQEKMKTLKNKINKMQREMTKKKQLMAENGKLRILLVDAKVEIKELRQIAANECVKAESGHQRRMVTRSRSLGVRIRDVLAEFEKELKEDIYPPTVSAIGQTFVSEPRAIIFDSLIAG